jgi:DNA uptake protein ComE-like DNA-binding protein
MYRDLLGGYLNGEQLKEAYRLNDTLFAHITSMSSFNQSGIKKININSISELDLAKHPYIGDKMAKNILLLRSSFKKFDKIEQLKQVPLMNEEKYRKIAPYIQL